MIGSAGRPKKWTTSVGQEPALSRSTTVAKSSPVHNQRRGPHAGPRAQGIQHNWSHPLPHCTSIVPLLPTLSFRQLGTRNSMTGGGCACRSGLRAAATRWKILKTVMQTQTGHRARAALLSSHLAPLRSVRAREGRPALEKITLPTCEAAGSRMLREHPEACSSTSSAERTGVTAPVIGREGQVSFVCPVLGGLPHTA